MLSSTFTGRLLEKLMFVDVVGSRENSGFEDSSTQEVNSIEIVQRKK